MELFELAEQYFVCATVLSERIKTLNSQLKLLQTNKDKIIIKRRIISLYSDVLECRRCAKKLLEYKSSKNQLKR